MLSTKSDDVAGETFGIVPRIQLRDARGDGAELGVGLLDRHAGLEPRLELEELAPAALGWRDRAKRAARCRRPSFDTRGGITPMSVVGMPSSVKLSADDRGVQCRIGSPRACSS